MLIGSGQHTHCHRGKPGSEKVTHWPAASSINRYISIVCCVGVGGSGGLEGTYVFWFVYDAGTVDAVLHRRRMFALDHVDHHAGGVWKKGWRMTQNDEMIDWNFSDAVRKVIRCFCEWMHPDGIWLINDVCVEIFCFFFIFKIKLLFLQHEQRLHCFNLNSFWVI